MLEMNIPTRHGKWKVAIVDRRITFYCFDKGIDGWRRVWYVREVPKTIQKQARCFIVDPKRYGTWSSY